MEALLSEQIEAFVKAVAACRNAAVVVHTHPDGDAIGSAVAMRRYLLSKGKTVSAIYPDTFPETLSFLAEGEGLIDAEKDPAAAAEALGACDSPRLILTSLPIVVHDQSVSPPSRTKWFANSTCMPYAMGLPPSLSKLRSSLVKWPSL